jgi:hypothetical protein
MIPLGLHNSVDGGTKREQVWEGGILFCTVTSAKHSSVYCTQRVEQVI